MTRTRLEILQDAQAHFQMACDYAQSSTDQMGADAVAMRLSAGIEMLNRLEDVDRRRLLGDTWPVMWGMRNRIAHGYMLVDSQMVVLTVQRDLPAVMELIDRELGSA